MQLDYASRTEGNLFESIWRDAAMTAGSFGAAYGARKLHDSMFKRGRAMSISGENRNFTPSKKGIAGLKQTESFLKSQEALRGHGSAMKASAKSVGTFAKNMSKIGHVFGYATMAQIGFSLGGGLLRAGESFRISRDQLEQQNYSNMYDQDTYYDTRAAFTQRQRALQVIHNSRLSLRPALGNESNYFHY